MTDRFPDEGLQRFTSPPAVLADRYTHLAGHADQGVGLDEFEGPRRYTRPSDHLAAQYRNETASTHPATNVRVEANTETPSKGQIR